MHRALYRKWRPVTFDDVCGQQHITDILKYQIDNGKISHAYLFCGSRGTGKTSCAKIFAKAVNCLNPQNGNPCNECLACKSIDAGNATDVIEMDAASNTGVDNVRDIKEEIMYSPAELKYRVYIIDEVHMMSGSAFNALLKTLEEPPSHAIFVLATTELQKLPSTIISRCQRYDFRRFTSSVIVDRLMHIAEAENIDLKEDGAAVIARMSLGGMRDAISLLELCASLNKTIDYELVTQTVGSGSRSEVCDTVNAILSANYEKLYGTVSDIFMNSRDVSVFFSELIDFYRDMMVAKTNPNAKAYLDLTDVEAERLFEISKKVPFELLVYHSKILTDAIADMQRSYLSKRTVAELALTRLCEPALSTTNVSLLARVAKLEEIIARMQCGIMPKTVANIDDNTQKPCENDTKIKAEVQSIKTDIKSQEKAERIFNRYENWQEILETVRTAKPSLYGALRETAAFSNGNGDFRILFPNEFFMSLANNSDSLQLIAAAVSNLGDIELSSAKISLISNDKKTNTDLLSDLDI